MADVKLLLYPNYSNDLRMIARNQDKGVSFDVCRGYDTVIRSDHIDDITLYDFVADMCSGKHPVAKEAKQ